MRNQSSHLLKPLIDSVNKSVETEKTKPQQEITRGFTVKNNLFAKHHFGGKHHLNLFRMNLIGPKYIKKINSCHLLILLC
jgi:hypothetical protein